MKITRISFDELSPAAYSQSERKVMSIKICDSVEQSVEAAKNKAFRKKHSFFNDALNKIGFGLGTVMALGFLTVSFGILAGPAIAAAAGAAAVALDQFDTKARIEYYDTKEVNHRKRSYSVDEIRQALQEIDEQNKVYIFEKPDPFKNVTFICKSQNSKKSV